MYLSSFPHIFIIISSCIYHHQCSEPEVVERGCRAEICSHSRCTCSYDDDADDDDADDNDDDDDDDDDADDNDDDDDDDDGSLQWRYAGTLKPPSLQLNFSHFKTKKA